MIVTVEDYVHLTEHDDDIDVVHDEHDELL